MGQKLNLKDQVFERLTVKSFAYIKGGNSYWNCDCSCGETAIVKGYRLRNGHTKSCGCLLKDKLATQNGLTKRFNKEYRIYISMIERCCNVKNKYFYNYGSRGIKVCDRWLESFSNFFEDMGEKPTPKHTIERKNNNGDYSPENCRWATRAEQNRNMRRNAWLTFNGEKFCVVDWSKRTGLSPNTIKGRLDDGWTVEEALTTTIDQKQKDRFKKKEGVL